MIRPAQWTDSRLDYAEYWPHTNQSPRKLARSSNAEDVEDVPIHNASLDLDDGDDIAWVL
jgi:hypothetical protein